MSRVNLYEKKTYTLLILLFYALYYLVPLEFRALWQPDEVRYAEISREMLVSGNWVVPHFLELRYFEKPIAGYWINNLSQMLFGANNFAVRFGSVFSISLSALLVYWLTLRLWQQRSSALLAAVIFLTCLLVYGVGSYAVLDPMITLWLVAAMCSGWLAGEGSTTRQKLTGWLLLGLACAMGFMTKGFLALAVPLVAIVPWMLWQRRYRDLLLFGPLTVLSAALLSAPWAISIAGRETNFWPYFFWVEHVQRFAERNAQHEAPFWYYLPVLAVGCLPWLGLLPGALQRAWRERRDTPGSAYLLSWVVMPLLFFSIAKGKLPTYILPCFAPLAILLAYHGRRVRISAGRALTANGIINLAFGLVATLALLLLLAPWGILHRPPFSAGEGHKVLLGSLAFLCWALMAAVTLISGRKYWQLAALCPLGVALVLGSVIPDKVINSKQPQVFINAHLNLLAASRFVLADDTGMASALAWTLKRSDILLFDRPGELAYGLSYADSRQHLVTMDALPQWLDSHRRAGSVALVMKLADVSRAIDKRIPLPDQQVQQGKMIIWYYAQWR